MPFPFFRWANPFIPGFSYRWNSFLSGNQMGDRFDSIRHIQKKEAILKDIWFKISGHMGTWFSGDCLFSSMLAFVFGQIRAFLRGDSRLPRLIWLFNPFWQGINRFFWSNGDRFPSFRISLPILHFFIPTSFLQCKISCISESSGKFIFYLKQRRIIRFISAMNQNASRRASDKRLSSRPYGDIGSKEIFFLRQSCKGFLAN